MSTPRQALFRNSLNWGEVLGSTAPWEKAAEGLALTGILAMVLTVPFSESAKNIAFGLAVGGGLAFWLLRRGRGLKLYPVGWAQMSLVAAALISFPFALSPFQGLRGAWDLFRAFTLFALLANLLRSGRAVRWCAGAFLVGISLGALWGLGQFLGGYWEAERAGLLGIKHAVEIHSLGHPNHTATYLLLMLALALGIVTYGQSDPSLWWLAWAALPFIVLALVFTYSRSALLAAVAVVGTFGYFWWRRGGLTRVLTVGALVAGLGLFVVAGIQKTRSTNLAVVLTAPFTKGAMTDRFVVWGGVIRVLKDRPLVGVGPRNFNFMDKYRYGIRSSFHYFNHAHSMYFNVLAEMGLWGFGALFAWLFCYAMTCYGLLKSCSEQGLDRGLALGATCALIALTVSGLVTTTLHTEGAMAVSGLLGLALSEKACRVRSSTASRGTESRDRTSMEMR